MIETGSKQTVKLPVTHYKLGGLDDAPKRVAHGVLSLRELLSQLHEFRCV